MTTYRIVTGHLLHPLYFLRQIILRMGTTGLAALALPVNLLEMQICPPPLQSTKSEFLGVSTKTLPLNKLSRWFSMVTKMNITVHATLNATLFQGSQ